MILQLQLGLMLCCVCYLFNSSPVFPCVFDLVYVNFRLLCQIRFVCPFWVKHGVFFSWLRFCLNRGGLFILIANNTHMLTFPVWITFLVYWLIDWLINWSAILTCQQSLRCHHSCHRPPDNLQDTLCRPPHQIPESAGGSFGLIVHVCASSRSAHPDTPQGIQETE